MEAETIAHKVEGDVIHLHTDGSDAADTVREALTDLDLDFTTSSDPDWPDDWPHPILNVRIERLNYDTCFRGEGPILFFFVDAMRHMRDRARSS